MGGGIADRHNQRRRFALQRADRTKHIGRGEAKVLWCRLAHCWFAPTPGSSCLLADASLVLKPYLELAHRVLAPPGLALIAIQQLRKCCLRGRIGLRGGVGRSANQLNFIRCSSR